MEIERHPTPPKLSSKAIRLITDLCFRHNDDLSPVDGLFVYATAVEIPTVANLIKKILNANVTKQVFLTGKFPPAEVAKDLGVERKVTSADLVLHAIDQNNFQDVTFFAERNSSNTLANVTETLKNPAFARCSRLMFIFKSHAAGRGYLTLKKFFHSATILQQCYDTKYERAAKRLTRNNWYRFAFGRERVWGEFLRIKTYGERGDIEYHEVKSLISEIKKEI